MSVITVFLGKLLGLYLAGISFAMFTSKQRTLATLDEIMSSGPWMLFSGMIATAVGLAIVLTQQDWTSSALAIAISLAGWMALIKGLALLVVPPKIMANTYKMMGLERYFYLWMGLVFICGLWIAVAAFSR